jgi:hypothetical protein
MIRSYLMPGGDARGSGPVARGHRSALRVITFTSVYRDVIDDIV